MLTDDVLLEIFHFYRRNHELEVENYRDTDIVWKWHILVHVYRRWRRIIFGSPLHLNLRILCTHGTPVRKSLNIWPTFPIVIEYGRPRNMCYRGLEPIDEDNVIAALEHPSRVCEVMLNVTGAQLGRIATVMRQPFPVLTHFVLRSKDGNVPVFPGEFLGRSAPCLQQLNLEHIPFPELPILLPSASDLITLQLYNIPQTGYISPEAMVAGLATLTRLQNLDIRFRSPNSRPDQILLPPTTRTVLPALTFFHFHGVCEYLEHFAARIDAPLLNLIEIEYMNELVDFEVPQLSRIINHSEALERPLHCLIVFAETGTSFRAISAEFNDIDCPPYVDVCILCEKIDWQLPSLTNVLSQISAILSNTTVLTIESHHPIPDTPKPDDLDIDDADIEWLQLLSLFSSVLTLNVCVFYSGHISRTLEGIAGMMATEVLPALHTLYLTGQSVSSVEKFIAARRDSDRPVTTFNGKTESGE